MKFRLLCSALASLGFFTPTFSKNISLYSDSTKTKTANYRASATKHHNVLHTKLEVSFDWKKSQMSGKAELTGTPHFYPSSRITLNARGMDIQTVDVVDLNPKKREGAKTTTTHNEALLPQKLNASFHYQNDSLTIHLGREFKAGEKYQIKITYLAKPNELKQGGSDAISSDKGLYFINPSGQQKNKMPQIWTQGETQANSAWFPTIDEPNQKMTSEILMTVDAKYTTLSNGVLINSKKNADGTRTDHWKQDAPHAPYLVMMAVGEFKKVLDQPWNGKEISYYVEKEYEPYAKEIFGNTKEMVQFYSNLLGTPYPWQKYAQIVVRDYVSGAMENTSATLHGDFMVYQTDREMLDGKKGEAVIAHELFHQWFGDLVTAESWSNLPLNESFATYGEYLWEEYKNGRDAADAHSRRSRMGYFMASQQQKEVNLIRYEYENREDMFDAWSYNKGGQILHMLRKYVGDEAFFASLKLYLERQRFKAAEIHHLRLAFEDVTGEDLNWFFNQWFLAKGYPVLDIEQVYDQTAKKLKLTIRQKQNLSEVPLYKLPLVLDVYVNGKKERKNIVAQQQEDVFEISCEAAPDLVLVDAERQLLGTKTQHLTKKELVFMYRNAPLYGDRLEALEGLKSQLEDPEVFRLFLEAASKDPWYEHRILALNALKSQATLHENELKPLCLSLAKNDPKTAVRAIALNILADSYRGPDLDQLYQNGLIEKSYVVLSASLRALASTNPVMALNKAKELENEKSMELFGTISNIYAKDGADAQSSYFTKALDFLSGYDYYLYIRQYSKFLKRCNEPKSFEEAANAFIFIVKEGTSNEGIKSYAKRTFEEAILGGLKSLQEKQKSTGSSTEPLLDLEKKLSQQMNAALSK